MSKSRWAEGWAEPDLSHAAGPDAAAPAVVLDDLGHKRRSIIPDPLSILIAAESGLPILVPIFGVNAYGPASPCPHRGPIPDGSPHYCPQCHDTGMRDHPLIRLEAADVHQPDDAEAVSMIVDPAIRAKAARVVARKPQTRRQRRAEKYRGQSDVRADTAGADAAAR